MTTDAFREELKRLLSINKKVAAVDSDTALAGLDSLTLTEICILTEEHFGVPLEFAEAKLLSSVGKLEEFIDLKKAQA